MKEKLIVLLVIGATLLTGCSQLPAEKEGDQQGVEEIESQNEEQVVEETESKVEEEPESPDDQQVVEEEIASQDKKQAVEEKTAPQKEKQVVKDETKSQHKKVALGSYGDITVPSTWEVREETWSLSQEVEKSFSFIYKGEILFVIHVYRYDAEEWWRDYGGGLDQFIASHDGKVFTYVDTTEPSEKALADEKFLKEVQREWSKAGDVIQTIQWK